MKSGIVVCFAALVLACLVFVDGLTPQIISAMDEAVYDELHNPIKPAAEGIGKDCAKRLGLPKGNSSTVSIGSPAGGTAPGQLLQIYKKCQTAEDSRFCRLMVLNSNSPDPSLVDWTTKHLIVLEQYDCFPAICSEEDIANSAYFVAEDLLRDANMTGTEYYSIAHCDETAGPDVGFFVTLVLLGLLVLIVAIGTLLDLYVDHNGEEKGKRSTLLSVPGWRSLLLTPKEPKKTSKNPSLPQIVITSASENSNYVKTSSGRQDAKSWAGKWSGRRSSRRTTPVAFPSLRTGTPGDRIFVFNHGRNMSVQRSPSCSPIRKSGPIITPLSGSLGSFNLGEHQSSGAVDAWDRSQSFTSLSGTANRETINISDPSVFVSSLGVTQTDLGSGSSQKLRKSERDLAHDRYLFAITPRRKRVKSFVEALVASSAIRGADKLYRGGKRKPDRRDADKSPLTFVRCMQTVAIWCFLMYQTAVYLGTSKMLDNPGTFEKLLPSLGFQFVSNAFVHLETMFFTSAIISTYAVMHKISTSKRKGDGVYTLLILLGSKFIRQLPFYLIVVLLWTFLIPFMGSGPGWHAVRDSNCKTYWWTNLFYITNFCPEKAFSQCMPWLWYPCCEMQMYIVGLPLTLFVHEYHKMGVATTAGSVVGMSLVSCYLSFASDLEVNPLLEWHSQKSFHNVIVQFLSVQSTVLATLFLAKPSLACQNATGENVPVSYGAWNNDVFDVVLNKPYYHWSSHAAGLIVGAVLYRRSHLQNKAAVVFISVMHLLAPACLLGVYISTFWLFREEVISTWRPLLANVYPKAWVAILVPVVFYYRYARHRGPINRLVSATWWITIGRLNLAVYVMHPIVLSCVLFSADYQLHVSATTLIVYFTASALVAYLSAAVLMLCGHYPLHAFVGFLHTCLWKQVSDPGGSSEADNKKQSEDRQRLLEKNSNEPKCSKTPSVEKLDTCTSTSDQGETAPAMQWHPRRRRSSFNSIFSPALRTRYYSPI